MIVAQDEIPSETEATKMKHSRAEVRGKIKLGLDIRFEAQNLTSYSGLIVFQQFFSLIGIKERLWQCFRHLKTKPVYGRHVVLSTPI